MQRFPAASGAPLKSKPFEIKGAGICIRPLYAGDWEQIDSPQKRLVQHEL